MTAVDVAAIAKQILAEATKQGGATWKSIQKSAPIYINGYAQNLADIAVGVTKKEISKADAKMYAKNAHLMLVMGIANTSQIMLFEVQTFIDNVLSILKKSINSALPIAIL